MLANMTLGQRVISLWLMALAVLVSFVIYLDGGFNGEPVIFFSFLWVIDIVLLVVIVLRCLRSCYVLGFSDDIIIGAALPSLALRPGLYGSAIVFSKFIFEIILYIQLRHRAVDVVWIMIPLWVFLGLTSTYLLKRIVDFHQKF